MKHKLLGEDGIKICFKSQRQLEAIKDIYCRNCKGTNTKACFKQVIDGLTLLSDLSNKLNCRQH